MAIQKVSNNSKVTEVDSLIKQSIAVYESSDWTSDIHLTGIFSELKSLSVELTEAIILLKNENESEELDDVRDDDFRAIYFLVQSNLYNSNPILRSAAETINSVIGSMGLAVVDKAYDIESSIIDSMYNKFETSALDAAISALPGLDEMVENLKRSNKKFKDSRVESKTDKADNKESLSATKQKKRILSLFNGKLHAYMYGMFMVDEPTYGEFTRSIVQIIEDNNITVKKRLDNN